MADRRQIGRNPRTPVVARHAFPPRDHQELALDSGREALDLLARPGVAETGSVMKMHLTRPVLAAPASAPLDAAINSDQLVGTAGLTYACDELGWLGTHMAEVISRDIEMSRAEHHRALG
jgi:hypothetical protein